MRLFLSMAIILLFLAGCGPAGMDGNGVKPVAINKEVKEAGSGMGSDGKSKLTNENTETKKEYKKPDQSQIKAKLTPLQFKVTQEGDTEEPFNNAYWLNKRAGIYVDIVTREPLFSSLDKFNSGTGWPSFTKPLEAGNVVELGRPTYAGTEVRSRHADSHLGHVFLDGTQVLHQLRLFDIHPQRRPRKRRLRGVLETIPKEMITAIHGFQPHDEVENKVFQMWNSNLTFFTSSGGRSII